MIKELIKNLFHGVKEFAKEYTDSIWRQQTDYVIEYGTSNGWKYRKWKSGHGEAIKSMTITSSGSSGVQIAVSNDFNTLFGVDDSDASNTILEVANGDATLSGLHVESATYNGAGTWYAVFPSALSGSFKLICKVTYFVGG